MMWKLWNKLFGWHYVLIISDSGDYRYVRKRHIDASDRWYVNFTSQKIWFLQSDGFTDGGRYRWTPLTWSISNMSHD